MAGGWRVLLRRALLERRPWIAVWEERVQLPNGAVIEDYFGLHLRSWVAVFAVSEEGRVPLVWQYRHGIGAHSLELPAGYLEDGEDALACARRELREEAGCAAQSFRLLRSHPMLPERSAMTMHLVLARGARTVGAPQPDETEQLAVRWLGLDELRATWRAGGILSVGHGAAIAWGLDAVGAL